MTNTLTVLQLIEKCCVEAERYKQDGRSDEQYCLELFRRALVERNETAWESLYKQYRPLVKTWVAGYSRFGETGEETPFFVNDAFARMWEFASRPGTAKSFDSLGKCLQYLKRCVWSAVENHIRRQKKDALIRAIPLNENSYLVSGRLQTEVDESIFLNEIGQILWQTVQNKRERIVAEESWIYDLPPRKIQANYPDLFKSVADVSQVKRNMIKRLRRRFNTMTNQ